MKLHFPIAAALLACCLAASMAAQTSPADVQVSLSVRPSSQMDQADAQVVAAHRAAIARAAAFYDFTLDASWTYQQSVCPLAPQDIILNYSSPQAHGVSSFSAVVPRQGSVIRIVPLVHDGTAPSVVPWGEHSYNVFNSMTAASGGVRRDVSTQAQWTAGMSPGDKFIWGLCYVALVNERAVVPHPDSELHVFSATEPTFRLGTEGGSELSFTVRDDPHYYSVWQLEFSPKGALIRADRDQHMRPIDDLEAAKAVVPEASPAETVTPSNPPAAATAQSNPPQSTPAYVSPVTISEPASTPGQTMAVSAPATVPTAVAATPPEAQPVRKTKAGKSDVHTVPDAEPLIEHPIPDGDPLVTHPVPQS